VFRNSLAALALFSVIGCGNSAVVNTGGDDPNGDQPDATPGPTATQGALLLTGAVLGTLEPCG